MPYLILVALIAVMAIDIMTVRKVRKDHPGLLLESERTGRPGPLALARFAWVSPPWILLVATRFAMASRSIWYLAGRRHHTR